MLKLSGISLMLLLGFFAACVIADGSEPESFENYRSDCMRDPACRRAYFSDPMLALEQRPSQRNQDWVNGASGPSAVQATTKLLHQKKRAQVYELESALYEQTLTDGPSGKGGLMEARNAFKAAQAAFLSAKQAVKNAAEAHKTHKKPKKAAKKPTQVKKKKVSWFTGMITDLGKKKANKPLKKKKGPDTNSLDFLAKKNAQFMRSMTPAARAHRERKYKRAVALELYQKRLWAQKQKKLLKRGGPTFYTGCKSMRNDLLTGRENNRVTLKEEDQVKRIKGSGIRMLSKAKLEDNAIAAVAVPKGWCARVFQLGQFGGASMFVPGPKNLCLNTMKMRDDVAWNDGSGKHPGADTGVSSIQVWHCPPKAVQQKREMSDDDWCMTFGVKCGRTKQVEAALAKRKRLASPGGEGASVESKDESEIRYIPSLDATNSIESMDGPKGLEKEKEREDERDIMLLGSAPGARMP